MRGRLQPPAKTREAGASKTVCFEAGASEQGCCEEFWRIPLHEQIVPDIANDKEFAGESRRSKKCHAAQDCSTVFCPLVFQPKHY